MKVKVLWLEGCYPGLGRYNFRRWDKSMHLWKCTLIYLQGDVATNLKKDSDIRTRRNSNVYSFQSGMEDIEIMDYTEPAYETNLEENNYESVY